MKPAYLVLFALLLSSCARPPIPVVVTLTAAPSTPTIAPVSISAPMALGATFAYKDGTTLVAIPSGTFKMGHGSAENPEHTVTLSDYWIYSTKVTNAQYALCVAQERCTSPDPVDNVDFSEFQSRNDPVVGVNYDQAQSYCSFMNASLPTEAQWEKAARGPNANAYPWGSADPSCDLLNFNNCVKHTTDVTQYPKGKSYYGALEMEGNALEWVADWYDPLYYKASPPGDPPGPGDGRARVQRGSSYRSSPGQAVTYARLFASPKTHARDLGFRCVVSDPAFFAPTCQLAPTVAQSELSSLKVDCPDISIDIKTSACRYGGGAIVTFNDSQANDPNASFGGIVGCTLVSGRPGAYPLSYECKTGSTAVLSTSCTYSGIQTRACPAHYTLDPVTNTCQWDGTHTTSIECPSGEFFNPVAHCCSVETGKLVDGPICPVGSVFTEASRGQYVCLPTLSAVTAPIQQARVNPPVCPGACLLNPVTCTDRNLVFCSTTCACISVGVKCPTH